MGPEIILILIGWAIAGGSPGPATLAISGASMSFGRSAGLALALGVLCGSVSWGIAAALGISAIMLANAWVFELIRYAGAGYLLYLAIKSLWAAAKSKPMKAMPQVKRGRMFARGVLLHLTNPKAILSWGSIYSIALPIGAAPAQVWALCGLLLTVSALVFIGYAFLFSVPAMAKGYARLRRGFDLAFGLLFGAASLKLLSARLT